MKEIAEKLVQVEQKITQEKGSFNLFALFLREDAPDVWDLVVAAPWISKNKEKSIKYIAEKIKKALKPQEIIKLSRIVVIEQDSPALKALQRAIHIEHGMTEVQNSVFFGLPIKHAYIITSVRNKIS